MSSVSEIEAALKAIVWGEGWQYGSNDAADETERYAAAVALSPGADQAWRVWVDRGNGDYWNIAFCGNGPTSEAHARLVANAPSIIRALLDALAVERENHTTTRAERDELRSELENTRGQRDDAFRAEERMRTRAVKAEATVRHLLSAGRQIDGLLARCMHNNTTGIPHPTDDTINAARNTWANAYNDE